MRKSTRSTILTITIIFALGACESPSTMELDADLAAIDEEISKAESDFISYGGAIQTLSQLRLFSLQYTRAMLAQKRSSLLRFVNLTYTVDGRPVPTFSAERLSELEKEIAQQEQRVAELEIKTETVGGMLQVLALLELQTEKVTLASLRQRYLTGKYGIPLLAVEPADENSKPRESVTDDEAL